MSIKINATDLWASLAEVVRRVRRGDRFTVLYRGRSAFRIVPIDEPDQPVLPPEEDSLYQAPPVGRSTDGRRSSEHDDLLYGR